MSGGQAVAKQRGIGLVELMIAITLSLLLIATVIGVFLSSKNSYRLQDAVSGLQENGRFALSYMIQDIRMAGFMGCSNIDRLGVNNVVKGITVSNTSQLDPTSVFFDPTSIVVGVENISAADAIFGSGVGALKAVPGTDALIVRHAVSAGGALTSKLASVSSDIQIDANNSLGLKAGDVFLVTDCIGADLLRASNVTTAAGTETIAHAASTYNTGTNLSKAYDTDAEVMPLQVTTYYIGDTGRKNAQNEPIQALYVAQRSAGQGGPLTLASYTGELVEGVEDMQIEYGVDTNTDGDGIANQASDYQSAAKITNDSTWDKVVSVRISLLILSESGNATTTSGALAQKYTFNGVTKTANDGRLRQVFSTVIGIRNRLL